MLGRRRGTGAGLRSGHREEAGSAIRRAGAEFETVEQAVTGKDAGRRPMRIERTVSVTLPSATPSLNWQTSLPRSLWAHEYPGDIQCCRRTRPHFRHSPIRTRGSYVWSIPAFGPLCRQRLVSRSGIWAPLHQPVAVLRRRISRGGAPVVDKLSLQTITLPRSQAPTKPKMQYRDGDTAFPAWYE